MKTPLEQLAAANEAIKRMATEAPDADIEINVHGLNIDLIKGLASLHKTVINESGNGVDFTLEFENGVINCYSWRNPYRKAKAPEVHIRTYLRISE